MKNKFLLKSFTVFSIIALLFSLSSCFDSEDVDTTLYSLTLKCDFIEADVKASYFNPDGLSQDDIDALLQAGASQEDIDKAGKCIEGKYYFFDQDPVLLQNNLIPGYQFIGWFEEGKESTFENSTFYYSDSNFDGTDENIWNMENKNITLEARYIPVDYTIKYFDDESNTVAQNDNYVVTGSEVSLPVLNRSGYVFKGFASRFGNLYVDKDGNPITKINADTLKYFEIDACFTGSKNNYDYAFSFLGSMEMNKCELVLFAVFLDEEYEVTFEVDEGIAFNSLEHIEKKNGYSSVPFTIGSEPLKVLSGDKIEIWVDFAQVEVNRPGYEFDGIYVDGVKVPDLDYGGGVSNPNNRPTIEITKDTKIEIKVKQISAE